MELWFSLVFLANHISQKEFHRVKYGNIYEDDHTHGLFLMQVVLSSSSSSSSIPFHAMLISEIQWPLPMAQLACVNWCLLIGWMTKFLSSRPTSIP